MSLRQKTREVRDAGAAKRRNWNPDPSSSHYKIYQWWLRKSGKVIQRENLCHYMRVVLIWAPLRAVARSLPYLLGLAVVCLVITIVVNYPMDALGFMLLVLFIVYVIFGTSVMKQMLHEMAGDEIKEVEWLDEQTETVKAGLVILTLPVVLVESVVVIAASALVFFLMGLGDDYDAYGRIKRWFTYTQLSSLKLLSWIRPWHIFPAGLVICSFVFGFARALLGVSGLIALFVGLVLSLAFAADWLKEKQKAATATRRAEEREMAIRFQEAFGEFVVKRLFMILHPEWVGDEQRFENWLVRYDRYCEERFGNSAYRTDYWDHLEHVWEKYQERFGGSAYDVENHYRLANADPSRSSAPKVHFVKIKAAFTAVVEVLALAWAFVLTKKWGICPIVELHPVQPE